MACLILMVSTAEPPLFVTFNIQVYRITGHSVPFKHDHPVSNGLFVQYCCPHDRQWTMQIDFMRELQGAMAMHCPYTLASTATGDRC